MENINSRNVIPANPAPSTDRIVCVDVLRGFDMFWLCGGTGLALGIVGLFGEPAKAVLLPQFDHAKWIGFTFYDFIFPLFVFVVGMSVVFSLGKLLEREGKIAAYRRIVRRFVLMYALGVLYYGGLSNSIPNIRWVGVLQRLALCYLATGILYCHLNTRGLIAVCVTIIVCYAALLTFVPVPGHTSITWQPGEDWAAYIDQHFLPGSKHEGTWDNNGIVGTVSAIGNCLMGVFASQLLLSLKYTDKHKAAFLIGGGTLLTVFGLLCGFALPIIKMIWTPSYVILTGGLSFLLLGIFLLTIDVWKIRWWTPPFRWIGANALTIYLARNFMDFNALADRFVGGSIAAFVGKDVGYFLRVVVSLALSLIFVRFLYRKGILLRV